MIAQTEVLAQLAEEAAELAQAALKLRRVLGGKNPTPVTYEQAMDNFKEELADVLCCTRMVGMIDSLDSMIEISTIANCKHDRWMQRLREAQGDGE